MQLDLEVIEYFRRGLDQHVTSVVAIDPGQSGAVARLRSGVVETRGNFKTQRDIVNGIRDLTPADVYIIEEVHAMPGQGVTSMFNFGESTGVARGTVWSSIVSSEQLQVVAPQRWQNFFWKTVTVAKHRRRVPGNLDGKAEMEEFSSMELAVALFPAYETSALMRTPRCQGVDHNICDAVLIAAWRLLDTTPARFA